MAEAVGYAVIPNWLVRDPGVSANAKVMYAIISSHCGRAGRWQMPRSLLASEMGMSTDTVRRALRELEALGVLSVTVTDEALGNHYTLNPYPAQEPTPGTTAHPPPAPVQTPPVHPCTPEESPEESPEEVAQPSAAKAAHPSAGPRHLPPEWQPTPRHRQYAYDNGITLSSEAANFITYFSQGSGSTKRHKDWDRAFSNWMLRTVQGLQRDGKWSPRTRLAVVPPAEERVLTFDEICARRDAMDATS